MKITEQHQGPMISNETPLQEKMKLFLNEFPSEGMNQAIFEEACRICLRSVEQIETNHVTSEILNSIITKSEWYSRCTLMSAFMTAVIVQNVPFNTPRTIEHAMAGALLHDIGLPALPAGFQVTSLEQLSDGGKEIYVTHPELGADLARKANLPEAVAQVILQHHEYINMTGYPNQLSRIKTYPLAKMVSLAVSFTEFVEEGDLPPLKALKEFATNRTYVEKHDPDAIRALIKGFIKGKNV